MYVCSHLGNNNACCPPCSQLAARKGFVFIPIQRKNSRGVLFLLFKKETMLRTYMFLSYSIPVKKRQRGEGKICPKLLGIFYTNENRSLLSF